MFSFFICQTGKNCHYSYICVYFAPIKKVKTDRGNQVNPRTSLSAFSEILSKNQILFFWKTDEGHLVAGRKNLISMSVECIPYTL